MTFVTSGESSHGIVAKRDRRDAFDLGLDGFQVFHPHKACRIVAVHFLRHAVVVADEEIEIPQQAAAEAHGVFPLAFEGEIPEVIHEVAGLDESVVAIRDRGVHIVNGCERASVSEGEDVPVERVVIARKPQIGLLDQNFHVI